MASGSGRDRRNTLVSSRRAYIKRAALLTGPALLTGLVVGTACGATGASLVLVEGGVSRTPIVVAAGAPPATRRAADELAQYIEKISGAKSQVIEDAPQPTPKNAIWVGYQPKLKELFPGLDFEFKNPEEILIAANENHLVIAGRDRWDPDHLVVKGRNFTIEGKQREYGTANAVYTFLEDYLDVRWLWPGEEDILRRHTIALPAFEYRFHPRFRQRATLFRLSALGDGRGMSHDWTRFQRIQLDSLEVPGGHAFTDWWDKYHEKHPEYFALQPDGTRSGFPSPRKAKLCLSNPGVWAQWLANVEEALQKNPTLTVFNARENDSHSRGICVCENCRAWDHPEGQPWRYTWQGVSQKYVAMTDRYVTFWNHLARKLKERFPDKELYVGATAYGPAGPPPVEAEFEDNIILAARGHFPFTSEEERQAQKKLWKARADQAPHVTHRTNLWYWSGGVWGLPEVAMKKTIEDFRFLAENRCVGLFVDTALEHWATQGPQYYLMGQLAWDPFQDGRALLKDYYRRGFREAAGEIESYWNLMEEARDAVMATPGLRLGGRERYRILGFLREVFNDDFLHRAGKLLRQAAAKVAEGPEIYQKRVDFVRTGFEFTRLLLQNTPVMAKVRESAGKDTEAVKQAVANWEAIEQLCKQAGPVALRYDSILSRMRGGYMGDMQDHLGPPSEEFRKAAGLR